MDSGFFGWPCVDATIDSTKIKTTNHVSLGPPGQFDYDMLVLFYFQKSETGQYVPTKQSWLTKAEKTIRYCKNE
jgi:hypothetical protein